MKRKLKNKFETSINKKLKASKVRYKYESDKIPYVLERNYIPDFVITTKTGRTLYIECKGYLRPEHKAKMVAVKKLHPELDIRIVFYSFNKKYIKWAERHGFPYSVGTIPEEWLYES